MALPSRERLWTSNEPADLSSGTKCPKNRKDSKAIKDNEKWVDRAKQKQKRVSSLLLLLLVFCLPKPSKSARGCGLAANYNLRSFPQAQKGLSRRQTYPGMLYDRWIYDLNLCLICCCYWPALGRILKGLFCFPSHARGNSKPEAKCEISLTFWDGFSFPLSREVRAREVSWLFEQV